MEFLGIGAPELVFILVIALILLGPKDMQKAGRTIGVWLNNLVRSDWWRAFRRTSEELRRLPTNLMREANREMMDIDRDLRGSIQPPSALGPRGPQPTSPVDPTPPPQAAVQPEPPIVGTPPGAAAEPQSDPVQPPNQEED